MIEIFRVTRDGLLRVSPDRFFRVTRISGFFPHMGFSENQELRSIPCYDEILGATKKICTFILKIENGAKSDFRSYTNEFGKVVFAGKEKWYNFQSRKQYLFL